MATIDMKERVKERYSAIATQGGGCCSGMAPVERVATTVGYTEQDLDAIPAGANLGLGCGNPVALASLAEGETVLDLGSGAGIDCFLAAKQVGPGGRVIGVDMSPEMLAKARANAAEGGYDQVEFREGEIENLPVDDESVDVIISNCVINLSTDKAAVFREAWRVVKPGGRAYISDIVLTRPLPEKVADSAAVWSACIGGALPRDEYFARIREAGFAEINVMQETGSAMDVYSPDLDGCDANAAGRFGDVTEDELREARQSVISIKLELKK